jgi:hypothetical protein
MSGSDTQLPHSCGLVGKRTVHSFQVSIQEIQFYFGLLATHATSPDNPFAGCGTPCQTGFMWVLIL